MIEQLSDYVGFFFPFSGVDADKAFLHEDVVQNSFFSAREALDHYFTVSEVRGYAGRNKSSLY